MEKNKALLIALPLLIMLVAASAAFALDVNCTELVEIVMRTPTNGSTVEGGYNLSAQMDSDLNGTSNETLVNLTFQAYSGSTANSSWATVCNVNGINLTTNATKENALNCSNFNGSAWDSIIIGGHVNSTEVEDAKDYYFRVTIVVGNDSTETLTSTAVSGVTVNYTSPTTASTLLPGDGAQMNDTHDVYLNVTVVANSTTNCSIIWLNMKPTGVETEQMVHSGSTCKIQLENIADGTYEYRINVTDGTDSKTTDPMSITFNVEQASPSGKVFMLWDDSGASGIGNKTAARNIALLGILGVLLYCFTHKNKY